MWKDHHEVKRLIFLLTLSFLCGWSEGNFWSSLVSSRRTLSEAFQSTPELVEGSGLYGLEEHHVTTTDGYILTIYKITVDKQKRNSSIYNSKEPILILHGFWLSSDDWLLTKPPEDNLAYLLTENGHEVWLGNFRGNRYSKGHISLTQKDLQYWDFSFDELGQYDVPAMINYVLNESGRDELSYVGFSMGCSSFFIAMERQPELQGKVNRMVALAPAVYGQHTTTIFRSLRIIPTNIFIRILNLVSGGRIVPQFFNKLATTYLPYLCSRPPISKICLYFVFLVVGFDWVQTTQESASLIVGHLFSPASAKTLGQWFQFINSGRFQEFDYEERNMEIYNSSTPPLYNLTNVKVSVKLLYGMNDRMVNPQDSQRVSHELGNVVESSPVNFTKWSHLDFIFARDAKKLVFDQCVQFLN